MNAADFKDHSWTADDGLKLYARDYGDDRAKLPVICIPGLTRNCRDFETVAPMIAAEGRRVLAVDLRGRGRSERASDRRRYGPATYAADMSALLSSIGAPRAIFIGTSLGGLVIMTLATKKLPAIAGAVLNDIGPRVGAGGLKRIAAYAGKGASISTWADAAAYIRTTNGAAFPDYDAEQWAVMARRTFKVGANEAPELDYDARVVGKIRPWLVKLLSPLAWAAFKRLAKNRPVLVVRGQLSDILEAATVERMKRKAPTLATAEIPRVGHAPMLDEPAAQTALKSFLADMP